MAMAVNYTTNTLITPEQMIAALAGRPVLGDFLMQPTVCTDVVMDDMANFQDVDRALYCGYSQVRWTALQLASLAAAPFIRRTFARRGLPRWWGFPCSQSRGNPAALSESATAYLSLSHAPPPSLCLRPAATGPLHRGTTPKPATT